MNDYEKFFMDHFEDLGSGCCNSELYRDDGGNCKACEWYADCQEGQDMVNDHIGI